MATKIPPHNLNEVAAAVHLHVERILEEGEENGNPEDVPNIDMGEYMQHLRGPDFPTGATIHGIDGIRDMYETGHGRFHVRSQCQVLDDSEGKRCTQSVVSLESPPRVVLSQHDGNHQQGTRSTDAARHPPCIRSPPRRGDSPTNSVRSGQGRSPSTRARGIGQGAGANR